MSLHFTLFLSRVDSASAGRIVEASGEDIGLGGSEIRGGAAGTGQDTRMAMPRVTRTQAATSMGKMGIPK